MLAILSVGFVLWCADYQWDSFLSIVAVTHLLGYVVGLQIALILKSKENGIEAGLWQYVNLSLIAVSVAMVGLAVGTILSKNFLARYDTGRKKNQSKLVSPIWLNGILVASIFIGVILNYKIGAYFHSGVCGSVFEVNNSYRYGLVGYLQYISYAGIVLQLHRYFLSKKNIDLYIALTFILIAYTATVPSGSRANSIAVLLIAFIYYLSNESSLKKKYFVSGVIVSIVILTTVLGKYYRNNCELTSNLLSKNIQSSAIGINAHSSLETKNSKSHSNLDTEDAKLEKLQHKQADRIEVLLSIVARRLEDGIGVGYLIGNIPKNYPFTGFENFEIFPAFVVPTLLKTRGIQDISKYNYATEDMLYKYEFRTDIGGSSPIMLIGEMYERFSWVGIFFGFLMFGFILKIFDFLVKRKTIFYQVLWALMVYGIVFSYSYSFLPIFILFSKQLGFFILFSFLIKKICDHFGVIRR